MYLSDTMSNYDWIRKRMEEAALLKQKGTLFKYIEEDLGEVCA